MDGLGYRLHALKKGREGAAHPDRNAQFEHINATVHTTPKTGAAAATDGIAGARINHVLDVHVDAFEVQRQ